MAVPARIAAALLLALPIQCAAAAAGTESAPPQQNAYLALLNRDEQIQSIGWRLARGNAPFCRETAQSIGLLLTDTAGFADPEEARAALGIPGAIAIDAVAATSPADRAGLRARQAVHAIEDLSMAALAPAAPQDYARLARLHDRIAAALTAHNVVNIAVEDRWGGAAVLSVDGETVCAGRFEVTTAGRAAKADGNRVLVSRAMIDDLSDESLLAAAVAHEFAHNLLTHPQMLQEGKGGWRNVRHREREADRLSVWLLANAGYDPAAAVRFMASWGRQHDFGFLAPTHDGWDERVAALEEELALVAAIDAAAEKTGPRHYDWSQRFPMSRDDARPRR